MSDREKTIKILQTLTEAFGPAGFEDEVRESIKTQIRGYVDKMEVDGLGNLIAFRQGTDPEGPVLMLDAHMDEIGLMVTTVDPQGFLRFVPIGGWDPRILPAQILKIRTEDGSYRTGVIGANPPHIVKDRSKPFDIHDLFVDVGATSKEEAEKMGFKAGCPAIIPREFQQLSENRVLGKALDDRAGCAVLIRVLERLFESKHKVNIAANFAVQEEVGGRGATVAAFRIEPHAALALEGTVGADTPGVPEHLMPTGTGRGPAITIMDHSLISNPKLVALLKQIAKEEKIPVQYRKPIGGGTDAGRIHIVRSGIPSAVVSIPCRYIHSPISILSLKDFDNAVKLVTGFCQKIDFK
ncbi:MAG: M42 family metallopeptidase [Candidatus Hermodarchaeota archaeon]